MSEADAGGDEWSAVGRVVASQYRITVVDRLAEGPAMPSSIAEETDIQIAHVSRALQTLREAGVVELLVPEETQKGRIYGLTDAGEDILPLIGEVSDR